LTAPFPGRKEQRNRDRHPCVLTGPPTLNWLEAPSHPLYEYTRDVDDPRLEPTPAEKRRGKRADYTTVCRRLVERASALGLLIES
jgi:hypothetical protein